MESSQQNPQNTVSNKQMNGHFYIIPDQKVQSNFNAYVLNCSIF